MQIRRAAPEEFDAVRQFYHSLIDAVQNRVNTVGWQKDVYPAPDFLRRSLAAGQLYLVEEGERLAGAMVANHETNESYPSGVWQIEAAPREILVIHALGVHPDFERRGFGRALVGRAVELARSSGMKALRLDVLAGNTAAERLYESCGFCRMASLPMYYEDTGWTDFTLYELVLWPKTARGYKPRAVFGLVLSVAVEVVHRGGVGEHHVALAGVEIGKALGGAAGQTRDLPQALDKPGVLVQGVHGLRGGGHAHLPAV